ncbi:MAG: hypothetical protein FWH56_09530 [Betaproteobacteria bacterium]|nr:hypothetical protein [Betaproteobacteria bacterium]
MAHRIVTLSIGILTFLLIILSIASATARDIRVNTGQYQAEAAKTVNARKAEIANTTSQARATSQAAVANANKTAQQSTDQIKQRQDNKAAQNTQPGQTIRIGNEEEHRTSGNQQAPEEADNNATNTTPHITVGNIVQTQSDPGGNQVIEIGKGKNSDNIKTGNIVQSGSGNKRITIGNP